ncbi:hypothetical protein IMZ48_26245 [Candidatus Bathyarchaeota archaeon]|nr:hypothetical protein [Candidatus Bathyarchaeota archaeon]
MSQTLIFPFKGLHVGVLPGDQPAQTSPKLLNVRPLWQGRFRGGQRPGLKKWGTGAQIGAAEQPVVAMCSVSTVS